MKRDALKKGSSADDSRLPRHALIVSDRAVHAELIEVLALSGYVVHCEETVSGAQAYVRNVSPSIAVIGPLTSKAKASAGLLELLRYLNNVCSDVVIKSDSDLSTN